MSSDQHTIIYLPLTSIHPAPENVPLYGEVDVKDPTFIRFAKDIKKRGIQEPIVVSVDGFIISGHRRYAAAKLAGLQEVPCRVRGDVSHAKNLPEFVQLLRVYNHQRVKTAEERTREAVMDAVDPKKAHRELLKYREDSAQVEGETVVIEGEKTRATITAAKQPFLKAILKVIEDRRQFWPLSVRQVHYGLLNAPPLKHASKPQSTYRNDRQSYESLTELAARARLVGLIPWNAVADETRPVSLWNVHRETGEYITKESERMLRSYTRDLLQSQPNHVELVGEKNTIGSILRPVARKYTLPMTIGRGYCSLDPRHEIFLRFKRSGKQKLVLLIVSDHDCDGMEICHSLARSMRDDFDIPDDRIHPVKVALTDEQVKRYKLPPGLQAKAGSSNHKKFTEKYGNNVYELEALQPAQLQDIVTSAIEAVIDIQKFNAEVQAEQQDAAHLESIRRRIRTAMAPPAA